MSLASEHFAAAHDHSAEFFGDDVAVKLPLTDYATVKATLTPETKRRNKPGDGDQDLVIEREALCRESDLPGESARVDLTWKIDELKYAVESFTDAQGGYVCFVLTRTEKREIARRGYRGRS